jgi:phage baseplate assembly protein V
MIKNIALTTLNNNGEKTTVNVSGFDDEYMEDRPFIEQYGFTSHPPEGSYGIALCVGGQTEKASIIGLMDKKTKKQVAVGEVMVYDKFGNEIHFKNGSVNIKCNGTLNINVTGNVNLSCPTLNIDANNVNIDSNLTVNGDTSLNGNVGSQNGSFNIGNGGHAVARVGDQVRVGDTIGEIITGSSIARSE